MVKGLAFGWDTILIGVLVSALCWKYLLANQSGFLWNLIKSASLTAVIACALLIVGGEEPGKLPTSSNLVGGHNQDSYSGDYYDIAAEEDSLLSYLPSDPQLVGNKLYINGMFSNSSREYDILDLSGVKIIVADKYGNEQARACLKTQNYCSFYQKGVPTVPKRLEIQAKSCGLLLDIYPFGVNYSAIWRF